MHQHLYIQSAISNATSLIESEEERRKAPDFAALQQVITWDYHRDWLEDPPRIAEFSAFGNTVSGTSYLFATYNGFPYHDPLVV
ncbi:MAG: hypothetical protein IPJ31_12980 [Bacteroidetes bacterium]|nr:hypothetical protein [Bacteroidota bacterium]